MPINADMKSRLQACCARAFPAKQGVRVKDLVSITAGWESDVYSFALEHGPARERRREELILRIYSGDGAHAKSAREFHGMRQLHEAGYPVPWVLVLERENSPFGEPFVIMERIEGQVLWPLLFGSPEGEKRQELLTLFCDLFVQLHTLEWRPFDGGRDIRAQDKLFVDAVARHDSGDPYAFIDQWLGTAHDTLAHLHRSDFLPVVEWLAARRDEVPCTRPSLVHLDFHPGNVLLRDDGSAAVIDWTQLAISDSRLDLAWTLVLVSSYEGAEWRDRVLQEYERLAGAQVEQIEFFQVFACAKRLFDVTVSLSDGAEKLGMRPDAVTMMKQQMGAHRRVYDLLLERTGIRVAEVERLLN